jgi:hypothetical protein
MTPTWNHRRLTVMSRSTPPRAVKASLWTPITRWTCARICLVRSHLHAAHWRHAPILTTLSVVRQAPLAAPGPSR